MRREAQPTFEERFAFFSFSTFQQRSRNSKLERFIRIRKVRQDFEEEKIFVGDF
jgi:hypothetical protein